MVLNLSTTKVLDDTPEMVTLRHLRRMEEIIQKMKEGYLEYLELGKLPSNFQPPPDFVNWVVNDSGELGVRIGSSFFWLYKGESFISETGKHDNGKPIMWRPVEKREFGEVCHPLDITSLPYTKGDGWQPLPASE